MKTIAEAGRRIVGEPYDLWRRGIAMMGARSNARRVLVLWVLVLAAVLADGVSTYLLLHPSQGAVFSEGNPAARAVMDVVGLNGWVFVGNIMTLIVLPPALIAKPLTALQRLVWWGGAITVVGKLASGSWNFYLYWITG